MEIKELEKGMVVQCIHKQKGSVNEFDMGVINELFDQYVYISCVSGRKVAMKYEDIHTGDVNPEYSDLEGLLMTHDGKFVFGYIDILPNGGRELCINHSYVSKSDELEMAHNKNAELVRSNDHLHKALSMKDLELTHLQNERDDMDTLVKLIGDVADVFTEADSSSRSKMMLDRVIEKLERIRSRNLSYEISNVISKISLARGILAYKHDCAQKDAEKVDETKKNPNYMWFFISLIFAIITVGLVFILT